MLCIYKKLNMIPKKNWPWSSNLIVFLKFCNQILYGLHIFNLHFLLIKNWIEIESTRMWDFHKINHLYSQFLPKLEFFSWPNLELFRICMLYGPIMGQMWPIWAICSGWAKCAKLISVQFMERYFFWQKYYFCY